MAAIRSVRGRVLEIGPPGVEGTEWIYEVLRGPEVHVPLGLRVAPAREAVAGGVLEMVRGPEVRRETVRFHLLRRLDDSRPVGFFLDFGWDFPNDTTREIDLVFPDPKDRSVGAYVDATVIVSQYAFENGLAKRLRWRVEVAGRKPARGVRQGARLISEFEERHPVSGEWVTKYIYEYAQPDYEAALAELGEDGSVDYGDVAGSIWQVYRRKS